jgi:hypothetical protein
MGEKRKEKRKERSGPARGFQPKRVLEKNLKFKLLLGLNQILNRFKFEQILLEL